MNQLTSKQILAWTAVLAVGQAMAATPAGSIGTVIAKSAIRIDSSAVSGNATVFSGNVLESALGTSELRLWTGGTLLLDTNSRLRVFESRAELEKGKLQMRGSNISAGSGNIRVQGAGDGSEAILERTENSLIVGALRGSVRVTNENGVLLASLLPGDALSFVPEPQDQGGAAPAPQPAPPVERHLTKRQKAGWFFGVGAAVGIPVAVVATRSGNSTVSR